LRAPARLCKIVFRLIRGVFDVRSWLFGPGVRTLRARQGHCPPQINGLNEANAPVAQLDRALPSEGKGHTFESCRVRQIPPLRNKDGHLSPLLILIAGARSIGLCLLMRAPRSIVAAHVYWLDQQPEVIGYLRRSAGLPLRMVRLNSTRTASRANSLR
jgi:hypothetical protein